MKSSRNGDRLVVEGDLSMKIEHYSSIKPCTKFVSSFQDMQSLKNAFIEKCEEVGGLGLAASQVGLDEKFFVLKLGDGTWNMFCNPKVDFDKTAGLSTEIEGCLSVPKEVFHIRRWNKISVSWQDEFGNEHSKTFEGFDARAIQHEYDHLVARSIVDRHKGQYRSGRFETSRQEKRRKTKR